MVYTSIARVSTLGRMVLSEHSNSISQTAPNPKANVLSVDRRRWHTKMAV
jgi:hypothetical protein